MDPWIQAIVTFGATIIASSGFWAFLQKKDTTKNAISSLLLGLAYDKIVTLGLSYIERGWISKDEYEDFRNYLFDPYKAFGGNGVGDRIMEEVSHLPLRSTNRYVEINNRKNSVQEIRNEQQHPTNSK